MLTSRLCCRSGNGSTGHRLIYATPKKSQKSLQKKSRTGISRCACSCLKRQGNKVVGENRKPGSVPCSSCPRRGGDHSSRTTVADSLKQPDPGVSNGPSSNTPLFGLAPDGVYRAADVTAGTGELLPHPFTLTAPGQAPAGGLLSVALSLGSPPVPVKDHPALWSPDFPPPAFALGSGRRRSPGFLQPPCSVCYQSGAVTKSSRLQCGQV